MTTKTPPTASPPPPRRKARTTSHPRNPVRRKGEALGAGDASPLPLAGGVGGGPSSEGSATPGQSHPQPLPQAGGERTVTLAVITGAHGIGGEVKLKFFTADLSPYRSFNGGALTLTSLRGPVARFAQVPDRTAAEALRGTELTVPRTALPPLEEGEYYHADLIGLVCVTDTGEPLGHVTAVENFGAGDILEIERPDGKRFMVPVSVAELGERVVVGAAFRE